MNEKPPFERGKLRWWSRDDVTAQAVTTPAANARVMQRVGARLRSLLAATTEPDGGAGQAPPVSSEGPAGEP